MNVLFRPTSRPTARPVQFIVRIVQACAIVIVVAGIALGRPTASYAAEMCASGNCVMACNASLRICSMFPSKEVPRGYARVRYMPFGYKRVRQSTCDKLVCPDKSTTCRRWTPTGSVESPTS